MRDDDFATGHLIDTGSFSNVYQAVHRRTMTPVALKKLFWTHRPHKIALEAHWCWRLSHPKIPKLLGMYRSSDQATLVFELVRFVPIRQLLSRFERGLIRVYMKDLFEALSYVHFSGVVHRDVKPANFLFDPEARVGKLIDFGMSEALGKKEYKRTGTRGFRAPERLCGADYAGPAGDLWAAGIILASILSGRYPFLKGGDDRSELIQISQIVGVDRLKAAAEGFGRRIEIEGAPAAQELNLRELCQGLNARFAELQVGEDVFDLLYRLLDPTPTTRITAAEALNHSFFPG